MEHLVAELKALLMLLDQESLSWAAEEKKTSVKNLLLQIQPLGTAEDYMLMNSSTSGTDLIESMFDSFDCDVGHLKVEIENVQKSPETSPTPSKPNSADSPPPLPNTPPPEGVYEEAAPLDPGKTPEYFTRRSSSSPPNSIEDGFYEDTDNSYPSSQVTGRKNSSYTDNDSDALSSSYESYDEEEEEKDQPLTHHWPSEENSMAPVRDCHICAFLLKKKRFGQWSKQLTVIRDNRLQCYKSSRDPWPCTDVLLSGCTVIYVPKDGRRKKHELRFTLPAGEVLVLAVQSKEQAGKWLQVVRDIKVQNGSERPSSPTIPGKSKCLSEKQTSDSDSVPSGESAGRENGKPKRGALSELTGTMSRAAGRKLTRIISFSKRKPPLPGDSRSLPDDPRCGFVGVLLNQCWKENWCRVQAGSLYLYHEKRERRGPHIILGLKGCDVVPGLGPKHPFALRILKDGMELAALEASSSGEMGRWLGVLLAEAGSSVDPESLHYDYVDVETIAYIRTAARDSFLWVTSEDSRTYDEVTLEATEDDGRLSGQTQVKRCSVCSGLKLHGSNAAQYGRYGKTRAQEDARRYSAEKKELETKINAIRNSLVLLRKKKAESKYRLRSTADKQKCLLEKQLERLEEICRQKEDQRVDLELQLTRVKENLKKSMAGGALGAPTEYQPAGQGSKTSLALTRGSERRKRPVSSYSAIKGTVMQKAKEWESKHGS